jgi:hypothetical protein
MSRVPERLSTEISSGLTYKCYTILENLAWNKHIASMQKLVIYGQNIYNNGPWWQKLSADFS